RRVPMGNCAGMITKLPAETAFLQRPLAKVARDPSKSQGLLKRPGYSAGMSTPATGPRGVSYVDESTDDEITISASALKSLGDQMQRFLLEYRFAMQEVETKLAILREEFLHMHEYNPIEH